MGAGITPTPLLNSCNAITQDLKWRLYHINLVSHLIRESKVLTMTSQSSDDLAPDLSPTLLSLTSIQPYGPPCRASERVSPILLKGLWIYWFFWLHLLVPSHLHGPTFQLLQADLLKSQPLREEYPKTVAPVSYSLPALFSSKTYHYLTWYYLHFIFLPLEG